MTTPLTLTADTRGDGSPVLAATGEIDMSNSAELAAALGAVIGQDSRPVLVDLRGVGYLDSAGLTVLLTHASDIEVLATPLLAPVLTICGLTDLTSVHGLDAEDAGDS
ncbi:STAS domain-containing protein [Streptacidiphilus neutrinimicus]|uniref:STAS domain-containing protein n=1 Tax=Streptacidiphilus neutrinimicus TaxID=105420 RepID=UPI0005A61E75|nr:STAS domain-containing protein [Streptacidiphilus neutrinimicus]